MFMNPMPNFFPPMWAPPVTGGNCGCNQDSNNLQNQVDRLERQVRRLEFRVNRLEQAISSVPMPLTNDNMSSTNNNGNNMYMM